MPAKKVAPKKRLAKKPYLPKVTPQLRARARAVLARLEKAYPDWGPTLEFADPLQLLVATILAAQAQDERINQVTRTVVFPKYRTAADYVAVKTAVSLSTDGRGVRHDGCWACWPPARPLRAPDARTTIVR